MYTGFTTDNICMSTMCAVSLANYLGAVAEHDEWNEHNVWNVWFLKRLYRWKFQCKILLRKMCKAKMDLTFITTFAQILLNVRSNFPAFEPWLLFALIWFYINFSHTYQNSSFKKSLTTDIFISENSYSLNHCHTLRSRIEGGS